MKHAEFFEFSMSCENHKWILDKDTWKEICGLTGKECEKADTCPKVSDEK